MKLDFEKGAGLLPVIVQDATTRQVLMLGFMNEEALRITQTTGNITFYSRSRQQIWTKGETSGNFLRVVKILPDCDQDTLLILAHPEGPTCHLGTRSCFEGDAPALFPWGLESTIRSRKANPTESSYTSRLFEKGINKIAQKVGEEAVELVIEAKDENRDLFVSEAADLLFHFMVLLREKKVDFSEVEAELQRRQNKN